MDERRQFIRLGLRMNVSYQLLGTKKSGESLTKDISGGGVRFFAEHLLEPGTQVACTVRLPDRREPIRFRGEVVWARTGRAGDKTLIAGASEIGVRFVEIDPKDQALLVQYAKMYGPAGQ